MIKGSMNTRQYIKQLLTEIGEKKNYTYRFVDIVKHVMGVNNFYDDVSKYRDMLNKYDVAKYSFETFDSDIVEALTDTIIYSKELMNTKAYEYYIRCNKESRESKNETRSCVQILKDYVKSNLDEIIHESFPMVEALMDDLDFSPKKALYKISELRGFLMSNFLIDTYKSISQKIGTDITETEFIASTMNKEPKKVIQIFSKLLGIYPFDLLNYLKSVKEDSKKITPLNNMRRFTDRINPDKSNDLAHHIYGIYINYYSIL